MFDPVGMCALLNDEGVDYVVLGGFAAVVHGSALMTQDVDLVPSRTPENLERLGRALRRMNAMIRTTADPVPTWSRSATRSTDGRRSEPGVRRGLRSLRLVER